VDILSWQEVTAISYTAGDTDVTFTPEQLSVILQIVALFNSPAMWSDYETYGDDIDAMIAELTAILTGSL
jgi:hypothetical protein